MCSCECTVIRRETRENMLKMVLSDRLELVSQDIKTELEQHDIDLTTHMEREGDEVEVFSPAEFQTLAAMMSVEPKQMKRELRDALRDIRQSVPEGLELDVTSRDMNFRDDGWTEHRIVLTLKKDLVEA